MEVFRIRTWLLFKHEHAWRSDGVHGLKEVCWQSGAHSIIESSQVVLTVVIIAVCLASSREELQECQITAMYV